MEKKYYVKIVLTSLICMIVWAEAGGQCQPDLPKRLHQGVQIGQEVWIQGSGV